MLPSYTLINTNGIMVNLKFHEIETIVGINGNVENLKKGRRTKS